MIRRLYIHNFRCLENFELDFRGQSSLLLIGKNGSGKTSIALALEILQKIARGTNRIGDLVKPKDFSGNRADAPMRFEIEVDLESQAFKYVIALEYPRGFKEPRVFEERLEFAGEPVFTREVAKVEIRPNAPNPRNTLSFVGSGTFSIDWHLAALPIIQLPPYRDSISIFKEWLAQILILQPVPSLVTGDSQKETLEPTRNVSNLGEWFTGLLAQAPSAYAEMDKYLKQVMPDLQAITNPSVGKDARSLFVSFAAEKETIQIPFEDLSDGEKCFMICALVLAANHAYGPVFCFWDEPDNYLAISEVGHFVTALRQAFQQKGQFLMTSHSAEAIQRFSNENTLLLYRESHLDPTRLRRLDQLQISGDLVRALVRDDLEP
ncbi:MAG: AAA family ATPase [Acidobacteriota bacterium]